MKAKAPLIIGTIFALYLAFVAIVALVYEPTLDNMGWEDRQAYNQKSLTTLTLGQNIEEVRTLLGAADFSEAKTSEEAQLQVLFYRTHHEKSDGITTKEECTPLLFKNDTLVAWGQDTYKQYISAAIVR